MADPAKCAHPSCTCQIDKSAGFGKYCSEHCKEKAKMTDLRCGCQHAACR